jgi:type I restriction enzyme, S subunit
VTDWPPGWDVRPLAQVADYETGRTPSRANTSYWNGKGETVPWVTISDLSAHGIVTTTKEQITKAAFESVFRGRLVPAGSLLMSFKLTIGRVATLGVAATHNEAIISVFPKPGIDQRYLGYYLSQIDYAVYQDRQIKGHTLNKAKLDRIPVAVPLEAEQKAIAHILDGVRAAIDLEREQLAASRRLKRAVACRLFEHGPTRATADEISHGGVPSGWVVERLGDSHDISSGGTPSRAVPEYWDGGTIPWVKTTEVAYSVIYETSEHITQRGLNESAAKMLPVGSVLLAMYGQGVTRGKVAILGIEAASNQACAAIRPLKDVIDSKFVYHYLAHQYESLRQLSHGGQQQNLNLDIVRDFQISYPQRRDEQLAIVATLDALDETVRLHEARLPVLESLFSVLLTDLMRGGIRAVDVAAAQVAIGDAGEGAA